MDLTKKMNEVLEEAGISHYIDPNGGITIYPRYVPGRPGFSITLRDPNEVINAVQQGKDIKGGSIENLLNAKLNVLEKEIKDADELIAERNAAIIGRLAIPPKH